ncbi:MAG: hypothetical protein QOK11_2530 [Pseudonocardiales bacterium]|nr:hypothetical protein [Pseudonocardiales bacterium]
MPTTVPTVVRPATAADVVVVTAALAVGLADDRVISGWLFPDAAHYTRYSAGYFTCYVELALERGHVWTTGDTVGALVSMPNAVRKQCQHDTTVRDRIARAAGPCAERAAILDEALQTRRRESPEHEHLTWIGVAPEHRGCGIDDQLLHAFARLAEQHDRPIYAESRGEHAAELYRRHGYERLGQTITPRSCDIEIQPLWREPVLPIDLEAEVWV